MSREEFYAVGSMPVEQADRLSGRLTRTDLARKIAEAVMLPVYYTTGEITLAEKIELMRAESVRRAEELASKTAIIEAILTEQNLP